MRTILVLFLMFVYAFAHPQITITHADFEDVWSVGSSARSYATPLLTPVSVFVGTESASAQTWDYTGISFDHVGNSIGVEPSSAPFISEFPEANAVMYGKMFYPGMDTITSWQYQRLDSDRLLLYGLSGDTSMGFSYDPPVLQLMIPLALGVTWERRDSSSFMPPYYTITEITVNVDAFGTLKLSSGDYQCLRVTQHNAQTDYTSRGITTTLSRSYHLFAKNFIELNILNVDEAQFNETTVEVNGFNYSILEHAGGIGETNLIADNFNLYPNPFQKSTTITYRLSLPESVTIRIFDNLGKEVRTLVNETCSAGVHEVDFNADGLPGGVYFCQIKSGSNIQSKKMVVTK